MNRRSLLATLFALPFVPKPALPAPLPAVRNATDIVFNSGPGRKTFRISACGRLSMGITNPNAKLDVLLQDIPFKEADSGPLVYNRALV